MSDEKTTIPTWGYHRTKEAKIFDLAEGESLPRGWADTPAAFSDSEAKPDEAAPDEVKPDAD